MRFFRWLKARSQRRAIEEIKGLGSFPHINFTLEQKNIKSIILKIKDKNHIYISSPYGVGVEQIVEVIEKKKEWIQSRLMHFSCREKERYCAQGWIYHLGRAYKIVYVFSSKKSVLLCDKEVRISAKEEGEIQKIIEKWQKSEAEKIYTEILSIWEERMGVKTTHLSIKKMSSRWGSCNPTKGYVNLNLALIKMPKELIEYVVVHELIHFYFYNHNKDFYAMMSKYLPQWKQREILLREWRKRI